MPIKRCPYCRSIINEKDRYCNSCGTQLLFPEDENVEEPVPGDRIIEAEEEPAQQEEIVVESIPAKAEATERPESRAPSKPDRRFLTSELPEMGQVTPPAPAAKQAKGETGRPAAKPPSGDFESGFPTSSKEMDEIARLLASLEKKEKPAPDVSPPPPPAPPSPPPAVPPSVERDLTPLREEVEKPTPPPTREELPAWAERVKEGETPGFRALSQESISRDTGDFSIDLPSGPTTSEPAESSLEESLPSADDFFSRRSEAAEQPVAEVEARPRRRRRKRGFLSGLKARIYDLLFVTLVWVLAVWAASRLLGVALLDVASRFPLEVGIFYLILLVGYFALFLSFLGETLGDRVGSSR